MDNTQIALQQLGWKAFQDLCVAIVEEQLGKPVQKFLPTNDAGRDGAFLGAWDEVTGGESTIQCKFTSKFDHNLSVSSLSEELPKAKRLAEMGLAHSYIVLTNYGITGEAELAIRNAFLAQGVGSCRVFGRDWIAGKIQESARLRMMMPRLYGFANLTSIFDERAYRQATLLLSEMGDNLQKLVVTDAHRKSVRALDAHGMVLLLGAPAAGKSTIGASLAIGAYDRWKCLTIKATAPQDIQKHLDDAGKQFFWIDDAWGSTQYQRDKTEAWNQVFPLMQAALTRGTRFLFTSRDYIWKPAKAELKLSAIPILSKSQVVINVHELTLDEKAQILYNHMKMGDQTVNVRSALKPFLPAAASHTGFLPETARRLGSEIFTKSLVKTSWGVEAFFARPTEFLESTIENLPPSAKAAIALVFLSGGTIRSPVTKEALEMPSAAFGVEPAQVAEQLQALDGNFLRLAQDELGRFWTYHHPTVSDAFASYVGKSPELIEIYLRGAKPENIVREVVCAGVELMGAGVMVPDSLHPLLAERIEGLDGQRLGSFISYRANRTFSARMLKMQPRIFDRIDTLIAPIRHDPDLKVVVTLFNQGLLPEDQRKRFINFLKFYVSEKADDSFLTNEEIGAILTDAERAELLSDIELSVLIDIDHLVEDKKGDWTSDYAPEAFFEELEASLKTFIKQLPDPDDRMRYSKVLGHCIGSAISDLKDQYQAPESESSQMPPSQPIHGPLDELFRDVDH